MPVFSLILSLLDLDFVASSFSFLGDSNEKRIFKGYGVQRVFDEVWENLSPSSRNFLQLRILSVK